VDPSRPDITAVSTADPKASAVKLIGTFAGAALQTWLGWPPSRPASHDPQSVQKAHARGDRAGRAVRVVATLLLLTLAGGGVAYLFMTLLLAAADASTKTLIQVGATGLTTVTVLTAIKDIVLTFQRLVAYVRGTFEDLFSEYVKYTTTVMAVSSSIFSFLLTAQAPADASLPEALSRPVMIAPGPVQADYFPYLFDLADGPPNWRRGAQLNPQQLADIEKLAVTLKACVGSLPNQDVILQVIGFADANEFTPAAARNNSSQELNRQTANRRAAALAAALRERLGRPTSPSTVVIDKVIQWDEAEPSAMLTSPRYFNAGPLTATGGRDQGRFNRRAEVILLRAGTCERYHAR
jgi:hypothetical protein